MMYEYGAMVLKVVDGDTLHMSVDLGFGIFYGSVKEPFIVRLAGINAPEMSTEEGKAARDFALNWVMTKSTNGIVMIKTIRDRKEKYGRYLGTIWSVLPGEPPFTSLNDDMVTSGHAVPYNP